MENGTFIYLYRKFKNWEWFKDSTMVHLFIYLLIEANFSDKYYRGKFVKRGQIRASRRELARETGITEQKVRTALNRLKLSQEITIDITQHDHIISICKYDEYQCYIKPTNPTINPENNPLLTQEQPTTNPQSTQEQPTDYPHTHKDNKEKNYRKHKNENNVEEESGGNSEAAIAGSGSVSKNDFSKGKEKNSTTRGKRGRPPAEIETFDPWLEQEEFRTAWAAWIAVRREKHNAVGPVAQRENMEHLRTLTDDMATAIAIVKYTTRGGYPMFYPLKTNNANPQKTAKNGFFNADTVNGTEHDYSITR